MGGKKHLLNSFVGDGHFGGGEILVEEGRGEQ